MRCLLFVLAAAGPTAALRAPLSASRARAATGRTVSQRPPLRMAGREPRASETNAQATDGSANIRQMLGFKSAASSEADMAAPFNWKIRLQLMKPGTWVPLIWGVACGAAASGQYHAVWNLFGDAPTTDSLAVVGQDTLKAIGAMMLSGPILCGFTQTINDWYDRDLDAINEPYRPIPSGAISEGEVYSQIYGLLVSGIALAVGLDAIAMHDWPVITLVASIGIFLAYIYSVSRALRGAPVGAGAPRGPQAAHSRLRRARRPRASASRAHARAAPPPPRAPPAGAAAQAEGQRLDGHARARLILHCAALVVRARHV